MIKTNILIKNIPTIIWGEPSNKVFIAIHGNMSNKEDTNIEIFADTICNKGYQVISFDLPEHGDRKNEGTILKPPVCIQNILSILNYSKQNWEEINLYACSLGAYLGINALKNENIKNTILLSPIIDMFALILNMMNMCKITESQLKREKEINVNNEKFYYDYYLFAKKNSIKLWKSNTYILHGSMDLLQTNEILINFANQNDFNLIIEEDCEHWFHTSQQLKIYKGWLEDISCYLN